MWFGSDAVPGRELDPNTGHGGAAGSAETGTFGPARKLDHAADGARHAGAGSGAPLAGTQPDST